MNDKVFDSLKSFIEEVRWKYPFELQRETRVNQDLGITGDEAFEFINAFSNRFSVDITNFKINNYFEPEGDWILPALIRLFTKKKKNGGKKDLTLGDLEKVIESQFKILE